ncbi:MAG: hypothetical protein QOE04_3743 [Mycobacterium sp.]|jgi:hypothetical protein|nr:hypothetical protein [Mycobacterium sp.]
MTDGDASVLIAFLDAQRTRALNIIAGLDERQLRTEVLPSGWTPLGMIEHLGHAERHWFQEVALGTADQLPWQDDAKTPGALHE